MQIRYFLSRADIYTVDSAYPVSKSIRVRPGSMPSLFKGRDPETKCTDVQHKNEAAHMKYLCKILYEKLQAMHIPSTSFIFL